MEENEKITVKAYTEMVPCIATVLRTDVIVKSTILGKDSGLSICSAERPVQKRCTGVWDTGCNASLISNRLALSMKLKPFGMCNLNTANGIREVNKYYVDFILPNDIHIEKLEVLGVTLDQEPNVLIGMDVIGKGDFAVTNKGGETMVSFESPAVRNIDFMELMAQQ